MAPRGLKTGTIIDKTLGVLELNAIPALIYLVVVTALVGTATYFTQGRTGLIDVLSISATSFVVGISSAYLLLDAMIRRTGLRTRTEGDVFLPYVGLSILYSLGVMLGFIAIILPGLFFMARWIIAQPMLIARGSGIKEAFGESWEETSGGEFQIIGAALALIIAPLLVMLAGRWVFEPTSALGVGVYQLASSAISLILLALGVAVYGLLEARSAATRGA